MDPLMFAAFLFERWWITSGVFLHVSFTFVWLMTFFQQATYYLIKIMTQDKYLFKILLAVTKKAITQKWQQSNPPTKDSWLKLLVKLYLIGP